MICGVADDIALFSRLQCDLHGRFKTAASFGESGDAGARGNGARIRATGSCETQERSLFFVELCTFSTQQRGHNEEFTPISPAIVRLYGEYIGVASLEQIDVLAQVEIHVLRVGVSAGGVRVVAWPVRCVRLGHLGTVDRGDKSVVVPNPQHQRADRIEIVDAERFPQPDASFGRGNLCFDQVAKSAAGFVKAKAGSRVFPRTGDLKIRVFPVEFRVTAAWD